MPIDRVREIVEREPILADRNRMLIEDEPDISIAEANDYAERVARAVLEEACVFVDEFFPCDTSGVECANAIRRHFGSVENHDPTE